MRKVRLGDTGPEVSAIGLGCMGMSEFLGPTDHDESMRTLSRALDLGVTLFDTSDAYGTGANERLIGEFAGQVGRGRVLIATKFGAVRDQATGATVGLRGDPAYVREACHASLRRLGTDHIDLYYQHVPDPRVPVEETVGAMAELVAEGKVRHLGLSNVGADRLRRACAVHPIAAVQEEWSLFTRDIEPDLLPACVELGVGIVPYSPLGRGFLTGAYTSVSELAADDFRRGIARFAPGNAEINRRLLDPLRAVAARHRASLPQVALAWLMGGRSGVAVVPIPGTKHPARLEENVAALGIELTEQDLSVLDPIAARVAGSGRPELTADQLRMLA
ncbi:MAG TPA: aldo/keto reductase [Candidatus Dormibacteraeota bacterium]|jgi:aryl-alcohol dehydrogenase-like predicted oxidoreductase|nr:aldo/keto reductase [Candidatus Dormibacteraeota bacterium]